MERLYKKLKFYTFKCDPRQNTENEDQQKLSNDSRSAKQVETFTK